jgi:hypothetical protein
MRGWPYVSPATQNRPEPAWEKDDQSVSREDRMLRSFPFSAGAHGRNRDKMRCYRLTYLGFILSLWRCCFTCHGALGECYYLSKWLFRC